MRGQGLAGKKPKIALTARALAALTNTQKAEAANYPFCTIEPNVGRVAVPDTRLETLAKLAGSKKTVGSQLEFVDIAGEGSAVSSRKLAQLTPGHCAGLVRGASEGAGLGNKFLANIREVSTIVQLLRCFDDTEETIIEHVDGSVDPVRSGVCSTRKHTRTHCSNLSHRHTDKR